MRTAIVKGDERECAAQADAECHSARGDTNCGHTFALVSDSDRKSTDPAMPNE